ncbi:4-carboxymuconolactone decarboxylase [uncultured Jatrophihabitans sp.]|uniref:bifunctional 3-oxoadipate enol-lactonase/4-carboxymuconolactone decarboxylase PcaDC n=1 Tax=uncultured Jatrophihabitans sp. TaxID=1610747 RepID=UPI0035C97849
MAGSVSDVAFRRLAGPDDRPALVLGPSLGTAVAQLWAPVLDLLRDDFTVLGWDLPGHGAAPAPAPANEYAVGDLAAAVAIGIGAHADGPVHVAGDSLGGAVGMQLALDRPELVRTVTVCCSAARIGDAQGWRDRVETVRAGGTDAVVEGSAKRWFAPGFADRAPGVAHALLDTLRQVDDTGYIAACDALATFDIRDRLADLAAPLLAIAGAADAVVPVADLRLVAESVRDGRLDVLDGVAHLAPAEAPQQVARLIRRQVSRSRSGAEVAAAGMTVRRAVLGDAHVDRAVAGTTEFTADFQDFITQYAWGTVWTRPGLSRRDRSLITLTALVAHGHLDELAMHVHAARRNGLSPDEIGETLLHAAIYVGVPAANAAFRVAQQVLAETGDIADGSDT